MVICDLLGAIHYAANLHSAQRRKGEEDVPYINHLIEVGYLLSSIGGVQDNEILLAGILHDAIEDTSASFDEITQKFGLRVSRLVQSVSDDKELSKVERKQLVLEHLEHAEDAVKLIKLADLCSNISCIPKNWEIDRLKEYINWTKQVAMLCAGVSVSLDELFLLRWEAAVIVVWGIRNIREASANSDQ
jgi:guanosine-3',5'-bis(diphosphate) 3'-pyrophosphohydrolase